MTAKTFSEPLPESLPESLSAPSPQPETAPILPAGQETPRISIVIPLYNEEESIPHLWEALDKAIANYGQPAEVIVIDDGSRDRSFAPVSYTHLDVYKRQFLNLAVNLKCVL